MAKRLSCKKRKIDSYIGTSSKLSGDIFSKSSLCIEGIVEGNIYADGSVIIGKAACVSGNIEAYSTSVSGKVKGNIIATDYARLASGCTVDGDIHTANFIADEGSVFNGKCYMQSEEESSAHPKNENKESSTQPEDDNKE